MMTVLKYVLNLKTNLTLINNNYLIYRGGQTGRRSDGDWQWVQRRTTTQTGRAENQACRPDYKVG